VYKAEASDRINAVLDILKGVTTAEEVQKKYDITSINSVYIWIGKYVSQEKSLSLEEQTYEDMATKSKDDQIRELKAQLKQARKEAELEKLRAHAYDTMINLAEEKFNIPIRKKSGTKQ
jgi:transposase-like protein